LAKRLHALEYHDGHDPFVSKAISPCENKTSAIPCGSGGQSLTPIKYYFTNFGIFQCYNPDDGPPLEPLILGGNKTFPEFQVSLDPCDPFPTDIYYLSNTIRKTFLIVHHHYLKII
jgi:hypothetical protein